MIFFAYKLNGINWLNGLVYNKNIIKKRFSKYNSILFLIIGCFLKLKIKRIDYT